MEVMVVSRRTIAALVCVIVLAATFEHALLFVQVFLFLCAYFLLVCVVSLVIVGVGPFLRGEFKRADVQPTEEFFDTRFNPGAKPVDLRQKVYSVRHLLDHHGL